MGIVGQDFGWTLCHVTCSVPMSYPILEKGIQNDLLIKPSRLLQRTKLYLFGLDVSILAHVWAIGAHVVNVK